jgi:hypothetical protein
MKKLNNLSQRNQILDRKLKDMKDNFNYELKKSLDGVLFFFLHVKNIKFSTILQHFFRYLKIYSRPRYTKRDDTTQ